MVNLCRDKLTPFSPYKKSDTTICCDNLPWVVVYDLFYQNVKSNLRCSAGCANFVFIAPTETGCLTSGKQRNYSWVTIYDVQFVSVCR